MSSQKVIMRLGDSQKSKTLVLNHNTVHISRG